ncbi:hypothetical protein Tco_0714942 [Tanacetum coccineum]
MEIGRGDSGLGWSFQGGGIGNGLSLKGRFGIEPLGVTKIVLLWLKSVPLTSCFIQYARMHIQQRLVRDLPCNTECRRDHCRSHMRVSVTKLATGRLVNGSSCDRIDMVIKDLDLEPKVNAMMRDFLLLLLILLPCHTCDALCSEEVVKSW